MRPRHRGHDAEPKAVAGRAAAFLGTIEALEYQVVLIRGNAGSVVRNREDRAVLAGVGADPHQASLASVLDCVVDQIGDRIKEKVPVSEDFDRFLSVDLQTAASLLSGGVEEFGHLSRDEGKVERAKPAG